MSESNRLLEPQRAAPPYREPFALPPHWYHDVLVYEAEAIAVYRNNWLCAGHQSELSNVGDFVRLDFCDESILVVRGRDNVLRAFYNVCQHRGHILVNERRGNLSDVIRCPYHSWGYELNGSLKHVPNLRNAPNFPVQDICLPAVTVSEYGSFVWVNLNPEASPIAKELSGLDAAISQYIPDVETAIFFEGNQNTLPINWKTQVDNAVDTYHFQFS